MKVFSLYISYAEFHSNGSKLPELEQSVRDGRLYVGASNRCFLKIVKFRCDLLTTRSMPDGKVCLNDTGELAVTKFAVEPVTLPA